MTSRVETIAEILWHRYSPEHEDAWPSPNADEYRHAASDILSALQPDESANLTVAHAVGEDEVTWTGLLETLADSSFVSESRAATLRAIAEHMRFARPSEQAVTEAMVARASAEYQEIFGRYLLSSHARRILKAAMEAGRHD